MNIRMKTIGLAASLVMAALAGACGPSAPPADSPADKPTDAQPATSTTGTPAAPTGATGGESGAGASTGGGSAAPAAAAGPAKSIPIAQSKLVEDLKKIGLNTAKMPDLKTMSLAQKKKVMPIMQKAMGYAACTGCHVEGDFKAETRNLKISREMWRAYTVELRDEKGGAVFCDTCHQGNVKVLNRSNKEALKEFMEEEYEHKLTRADKADMECSTCHGDTMEMKIIEKLWKIPADTTASAK